MAQNVVIVVGCPGTGKSWVCERLKDKYEYVAHDKYMKSGNAYIGAIIEAANAGNKPVVCETPFSLSEFMRPLEKHGLKVTPVFILEHPLTIKERYEKREGRPLPEGHITRQQTYAERAWRLGAFSGTSEQVLNHLRQLKP